MDSLNTMLAIDLIIVILGIYLFFLSLRMKKSKKVDKFILAEELISKCKQETELAEYLSLRLMIFSIVITIGGGVMALNESFIDIGKWIYLVVGIVAVAFFVFFKQLTDARIKYC
ncbi:MAG: hypothetical protein IJ419_12560 [Agathobacter sp.]|nr:hypothetical protein [Agathobacter sp.]